MNENHIARIVVDAAFLLHKTLGPGLLESVYETLLSYDLRERGLHVEQQKPIPLIYKSVCFDQGFRADLVINHLVIIELKSVETIAPVHGKQLLTYLRVAHLRLGLLINFGESVIRDGIHRVVNGLQDCQSEA